MTLTQTAILTRRGVIAVVCLIILWIGASLGYKVWYKYYLSTLPPVEEKAEMKFGTLPEPKFGPSGISSSNYSYSLDTTTGGFPQVPKFIKVYFLPQTAITLLASDKSQKLADSLGFPNRLGASSSTNYKFTDERDGVMDIDLASGNFSFQRNISGDSARQIDEPLTDQAKLVTDFKGFLQEKGLLTPELKDGRSSITYFPESSSSAISADISLFPQDLDSYKIVTSSFKHGLVRATAEKNTDDFGRFTKFNYTFWPIDITTSSTYPLKTPDQAFSDLKTGKGFIAIESPNPKVSVSSVYLAYFESEEYSPYLQPVYVFEGPEFAALVTAI